MKSLWEMKSEAVGDVPEVYVDMDQVLCNFMKSADKASGGSFINANKAERWNKISNTDSFWSDLEWMPSAKKVYQKLVRYDMKILSAFSSKDSNSKSGKMKWLSKNTKIKRGNIHLVMRSQKQKFATTMKGRPNVLVDDYIKNIKEWEANGGIGIHHTDVGKTLNRLSGLGFK